MDSIQKFVSDIEKIKKHERRTEAYSGERACLAAKQLFDRLNKGAGPVAGSFSQYWLDSCVRQGSGHAEEPTAGSIEKLAAMHALLAMEPELTGALDDGDWKELCGLTGMDAEDVPLDLLNFLMAQFLEHRAL